MIIGRTEFGADEVDGRTNGGEFGVETCNDVLVTTWGEALVLVGAAVGVSVPPRFDGVFWGGVGVETSTGGKGSIVLDGIGGGSDGRSDAVSGKYGEISGGTEGIGRPASPKSPKSGPVVNKARRERC
jgi:hypothetical protein